MILKKRLLLSAILSIFLGIAGRSQSGDFAVIRERVVEELMEVPVSENQVREIMENMKDDGSFNGIDYSDLSRTAGFPHRRHTGNLVALAKAFKTNTGKFFHDPQVKEVIIRVLKYWTDHDYFGDNWHNNQISTPTNLVNLMLIMGEELPRDLVEKAQPIIGRAHMEASGARPSGDRIVIAGILAKNLLFNQNQEEFDKIIKLIEGEIKFTTGERGMQHDYSFHHRTDRVNNTTSYGYGKYANEFGEWSYYVAGTRYAFSVEKINQLIDYYLDGVYKQLVYGIYEDVSVKNRSISSKSTFTPRGTEEIERLLVSTDYRKDELEEIIRLRKGETKPSQSFCKFFWQTEHFVCQRPGFYTTVRMFSTRNRNMEEPYNGPGKFTHHRADGTNYLMLKGNEYQNIWAACDWQKIPGTTILQKPSLPGPDKIQMEGLTEFVGAVTDGQYGAVVFDFISPHDLTEAKKSWFFFEDDYVCLGADIRSTKDLPVVTTINHCLMQGEVTVMADNNINSLPHGRRQLDKVKWVYHDKVGYILPETASVYLSNQTEHGRWSDITDQKNISKELVNTDIFMLWFDHGKNPSGATYEYIVVPDISVDEFSKTALNNRDIEILANNSRMQAVINHKLGICQAVFYEAGELEIAEGMLIKMESPGLAMLKLTGNKIERVSLSDPSRKLKNCSLQIPGIYATIGKDFTLKADKIQNRTIIEATLPPGVWAGKSVDIQLINNN
jgi:chondroitin AC lyase